ncbi:Polyprenyl synthetase-related protein [Metarhizium robertsii ARSEF 23]|uniref:Geranylgeranyl pyrophosphate synthase subD n=1 Tax=Metarhizium robertsii (strain ARSEF 23 / ATCC MYA-3075) TaxID=655844 RepID=SUBD_METRA|nr:Polyprenyl synthetase-related protein [Metarhizium robertsii ARSEF 23]E9F5E9.1 RecName: Full=Geranylgeranyl pyrophosphate synthase subD; Short=GGPP synthase; Short=GGPPSase; AltName: Full=(2E,6E)-farnesyl diphosphate synthase; AltName: Full=Dimethylallyltranstransferase; AltName: Full=Farnesyl diphosphate synthase; AltName: Full=Farnesyltranstransferase; AltName: Full=Geranylgeranyl diphosphate synthase; AltName: Full=Geranyltranstransferase; AltName: Full=Subglutinol biosynthesis cluster prote
MSPSAPNTNELNSPVLETQPLAGDAALLHSSIAAGYEEIIRAPFDYLLNLPGKDVRSKMISAFNEWLCIPADKLEVIKRIVMLLHNASLLIDDIQDSSKLRRGLPVSHHIFGVPQTINAANYAYFLAQQELPKLGDPKAFEIYTEELLSLHRGQGMDIYWREASKCPTEEEYFSMVSHKTGGLFRLAIRLMQLASDKNWFVFHTRDFVPLVNVLGVIFQIRDDYLNLQSHAYTVNKGFGEDLTEGKYSFPIIHSIRSDPTNIQLSSILKQRTTDVDVKLFAVECIKATGSFEHCKEKIAELVAEARQLIKEMGNSVPGSAEAVDRVLDLIGLEPESS